MNPRLRRLQSDYELIREIYSGHPYVSVEPIGAVVPPESYRVTYRVSGLQLVGDQPEVRESHEVELMLPRRYPAEKPYVVPLEPIFHPNIKDYFCIADYWAAGTTLVDVIAKMGDMIQWKIYNPASPLDPVAARWATEHEASGIFPFGDVALGVADFEVGVLDKSTPEAEPEERAVDIADSEDVVEPEIEPPPPPAAPEVAAVAPSSAGVSDDDFDIILK